MTVIIDYDAGNIKSVEKALQSLGETVEITDEAEKILAGYRVILPGVGAFGDAMENLNRRNLVPVIKEVVKKKIPFLGYSVLGSSFCLNEATRRRAWRGWGFSRGSSLRIPASGGLKIPHMGWNSLHLEHNGRLFRGIEEQAYVYFVHSFYLKAAEEEIVKASTEYGVHIHASVEKDNVFACQFHPEKSGDVGLRILKNFVELG